MLAALNKEKLASKFMAFKGQFKPYEVINSRMPRKFFT